MGDGPDARLDNFAPAKLAGQPEAIRGRGIESMKKAAKVAFKLGVTVITGFTGSPIWKWMYSFPQTTEEIAFDYYSAKRLLEKFKDYPEFGLNFRSPGHGQVNFEEIIRVLNQYNYDGPLSVEWEDSGMDCIMGATETASFTRRVDFRKSDIKFDDAISN